MKVAPPRSLMIRRTFIPENPLSPAFESRLNRQGQRRQNWCHRTCNKTTSPIVYYEFARCVRPERSHFQHRPVQTTKQTMCNMDSSSRLGGKYTCTKQSFGQIRHSTKVNRCLALGNLVSVTTKVQVTTWSRCATKLVTDRLHNL